MTAEKFLSHFTLIDSTLPLRRFGAKEDGGYILANKGLDEIARVYSYGIANETSFEEAILDELPECRVFGFDPTIEGTPRLDHEARFKFHKIGLACGQGTHFDHRLFWQDKDEPHIIKADVEGAEVPWMTTEKPGSTCRQVVLELHGLECPDKWEAIAGALEAMKLGFALVHAHVNNYAVPCFTRYGDFSVPSTLELTFIRWSMLPATARPNKRALPLAGLDYSNNPQIPDPSLTGWPWQR